MPTTKERILVTLTPDMARDIKAIAKRERTPKATIAARLMRRALDDAEDRYLAALSDKRFKATKRWVPAEEVWKRIENKQSKLSRRARA